MNFLCWFYNSVFASTVFMHVFSYVFILLQSSLYQKGSSIIQSNANLQLPLYALISRQQGANITGDLPKGPESHLQVWGLGSFLRARTSGSWFSVWCLGPALESRVSGPVWRFGFLFLQYTILVMVQEKRKIFFSCDYILINFSYIPFTVSKTFQWF